MAHFAQFDKSAFMGEIRYIIIAKQCEVGGKSLILKGCLKKSFSSVYDFGKQYFGHPSRINDFLCNTVLL